MVQVCRSQCPARVARLSRRAHSIGGFDQSQANPPKRKPISSRETELTQKHAIRVVTEWMGNPPAVALRHYLQVTDANFERAVRAGSRNVKAERVNLFETPACRN